MSDGIYKINEEFELRDLVAFQSLKSISTTYLDGLEKSILELAKSREELYMSDIINRFGNYPNVRKKVKRLMLENKIRLYETRPNSIENRDFEHQKLELVDKSISQWILIGGQPCLTCSLVEKCKIGNPVSPANCDEFNQWLEEEIQLEFPDENI